MVTFVYAVLVMNAVGIYWSCLSTRTNSQTLKANAQKIDANAQGIRANSRDIQDLKASLPFADRGPNS